MAVVKQDNLNDNEPYAVLAKEVRDERALSVFLTS